MSRYYLAADLLFLLAHGGRAREHILKKIENTFNEGGVLVSSIHAYEELHSALRSRGVREGAVRFLSLMEPLIDSLLVTEHQDLEQAFHLDARYSIGFSRSLHAALVMKEHTLSIWSPDSAFDKVYGVTRVDPFEGL